MKHLWEYDHPYYAKDGCYFTPGTRWHEVHTAYPSWRDFLDEWGDMDPDLNLVYRWDWNRPDPEDYSWEREHDPDFVMPDDTLHIYFMLQRKAKPHSIAIDITEAEEPAVRAWLTRRAQTVRAIWSPLLDEERASEFQVYCAPGSDKVRIAPEDHRQPIEAAREIAAGILAAAKAAEGVSDR